MQIVSVTSIDSNIMTDEQFIALRKFVKKHNPRGSKPAATLQFMIDNKVSIKKNIEVLTNLAPRCDDYYIKDITFEDWVARKNENPNKHMQDYEWDEYIDAIIYEATEGTSVGDWDAKEVDKRIEIQEHELVDVCNALQAANICINIDTVQKELKLMGREHPMNGGYIEGFLEDYLPTFLAG